jgi:mercuric ion transport protein
MLPMKDTSKTLTWVFAVITCPCHLFILAVLLAGTAAGAFVKSYFTPLLIVFSILFAISLFKALKTK